MSEPADGPPESRTGREPLSLRFANTRRAVRGQPRDDIGTPELLQVWLTRHVDELGMTGAAPQVDRADVVAFVDLRNAIRELIALALHDAGSCLPPAFDGDRAPVPEDRVAMLNRLSTDAPTWPTLMRTDGRFQVVERTTADTGILALATLAKDAITLLGDTSGDALRACGAPGCVQFFVKDHPRREWCSPGCGNRVRAARHYLRRRDA